MSNRFIRPDDIDRPRRHGGRPNTHNKYHDDKEEFRNKVIHIRSAEEYKQFKKKYSRAIVFYGGEWCHICKDMEGFYKRIAERYGKRITFAHVDVDEAGLDFSSVPVFTALRNGREIGTLIGGDKEKLKELIKGVITAK